MKRILALASFAVLCLGQQGKPTASLAPGWWDIHSTEQTVEGHVYNLRGDAQMKSATMLFRADNIRYDEDKAVVHMTGHVTIETDAVSFRGEDVDYDMKSAEIQTRSGDVKLKLKQGESRK